MTIEQRLAALNLELPGPAAPAGNYVPFVVVGNLVYVAGQLPRRDDRIEVLGKLGADVDVTRGQEAARLCALNALTHLRTACGGDLERVVRCVRLTGYVNCTSDFTEQPKVLNGASDLMVEIFGDRGRHVRVAVGANALPGNAACEIESLFEIRI
jgi:enamine deaminase RidA (YjgF/YER057c/UK114 family)